MIAGQDHNRVFFEARRFQGRDKPPDLIVKVRDGPVISPARRAHSRFVKIVLGHAAGIEHAPAVRVERTSRHGRHTRRVDPRIVVAVPIFPRDGVGVMGMGEGHVQEERPRPRLPAFARQVVYGPHALVRDLLVEIHLQAAFARPRLGDAEHGVIKVLAFAGPLPIGRPAEVGRVDIGRHPALETVQLIRPDEVHLSR